MIHPLLLVIFVQLVKNFLIFPLDWADYVVLSTNITILQYLPLWSWITVYNEITIPKYMYKFSECLPLLHTAVHIYESLTK